MFELHCEHCDTTFQGKDYDEAGKQFMFHDCDLGEEEL